MVGKKYVRPCFECIRLRNEDIMTNIFQSIDNDLQWSDIVKNPSESVVPNRETIIFG